MRVLGLIVALVVVVAWVAGCGGKELKTAAQADDFIEAIARGGSIDDWVHEAGAIALADNAWSNRSKIQSLGAKLRKEAEWACDVAGYVQTAGNVIGEFRTVTSEEQVSIVYSAEEAGVSGGAAESLIDEILYLTDNEAVETVNSACDATEGY